MCEVLERELGERRALHVDDADGVEGDVDAARRRGDGIGVLVDGSSVESVELGYLGAAACGRDLARDLVELREAAPGQEDTRALAGERPRAAPPTAPPAP